MSQAQQKQVELSLESQQAIAEVELASGKIPQFGLDVLAKIDSGELTADEAVKLAIKKYCEP